MFDGLKDKLGKFTSDVEEDVDEDAVEEEPDSDGEPADDEVTQTQDEADSTAREQAAVDDATASGATAEAPDVTSDASAVDSADEQAVTAESGAGDAMADSTTASGGSTADTTTAPEPTAEASTAEPDASVADSDAAEAETASEPDPASEPESDEETDESDDGGRSLTEKAKIFATGKTVIDEDDLAGHLDDLELALLQSDVEMGVAEEILDNVEANLTGQTRRRLESTGNLVRDALREALYEVISVGQFDFDQRIAEADKPVVIVFTGVNGVGKTTTIAKLSRYLEDRGLSSVLANGDTYRAGANEQLEQHARNRDVKCISHEQGSDTTAVIYDAVEYAQANGVDVVLGDTAGRLHTDDDLMAQLEKIDRVIDPDMTLFVDEAVAGQDAVNRAEGFNDAAEVDGAILTKADADPQGGAAISIAHVTGKPILFLGTGQDYDDLTRFDPEEIVDRLLG